MTNLSAAWFEDFLSRYRLSAGSGRDTLVAAFADEVEDGTRAMFKYLDCTEDDKIWEACFRLIAYHLDWFDELVRESLIAILKENVLHSGNVQASSLALSCLREIIESFPDKALQAEFLPLLLDERYIIRLTAAVFFGSVRDEHAVPYLAQLLDDPDSLISQESYNALGAIGTSSAIIAMKEWEKRQ